ncbi:oligosaccharide flippase family protein [Edaphovirga cremea]|uniref:oligosaccharide flippase family protein n=1 Tax=Edaphovirga cremea TaxID=2267246 RepID=UPI003989C163
MKVLRKDVVSNAFWMMSEKLIAIFGLIFVTSYVAKYIGPANFGKISFAAAIFVIIQSISLFGSDSIIFKRISRNKESGVILMTSTKKTRAIFFCVLSIPVMFYLYLTSDFLTVLFGAATCLASYFTTLDVYSIYNNATLSSKINTVCNTVGLMVGLLVRFLVAKFDIGVEYLAIPIILTSAIPYWMKRVNFRVTWSHIEKSVIQKRKRKKYINYLVGAGLPLAISGVSITLYTRLSQLFLMKFGGDVELGIFSAASSLATAWTFVTLSVITSYYAKIYNCTDRKIALKMASKLNGLIAVVALLAVIGIYLFGKFVIFHLYGNAYEAAYNIMLILSVATFFAAMGPVAYRYIVYESGYKYLSYKMFITFLVNLPLAFFLTKKYGMYGAAYSTLLTELLSLTILNYFFKRGVILKMHILSTMPKTYM